MQLTGRTALVTGASRGIGRAIALSLAEEGADVAVNYLSKRDLAADVVDQIRKMGCKAMLAQADVADYPDTHRMAREVLKEFGHLDILINNAGINSSKGITVNCVAPGFTETEMVMAIPEKVRMKLLEQIPMKRFGRSEEVARACVYLCSTDGDYITGAELSINGGLFM